LDTVAKSVLVAIRYQPKKFTLGTRTDLSPQAKEYVRFFAQKRYIGQTAFSVWLPLEDPACTKLPKALQMGIVAEKFFEFHRLTYVSLQVEDLFSSTHVDTNACRQLVIERSRSLRFRAIISPPTGKFKK
jgi:hypothetical protein